MSLSSREKPLFHKKKFLDDTIFLLNSYFRTQPSPTSNFRGTVPSLPKSPPMAYTYMNACAVLNIRMHARTVRYPPTSSMQQVTGVTTRQSAHLAHRVITRQTLNDQQQIIICLVLPCLTSHVTVYFFLYSVYHTSLCLMQHTHTHTHTHIHTPTHTHTHTHLHTHIYIYISYMKCTITSIGLQSEKH